MSREIGTFNFAANFEVLKKAPLDAKQLVTGYSALTATTTWNASGNVWLYDGAIVSVRNDSDLTKNGIYYLCDSTNYNLACSWIKAGTGEGVGTLTGATNGLFTINSGTTVVLGGLLTGNTTFSGGTLRYASNISGTYDARSLVDAEYVTGQTANLQADIDYISGVTSGIIAEVNYISGITAQNVLDIDYISGETDARLTVIEAEYITGATNGLTKYACHDVCLGGTLISPIIFTGSDANHLCYASDYSGGYTDRSIPDVAYVDAIASGLAPKGAACVATTINLTYPFTGLTTIDGITVQNGWRILVKDQSPSGQTNGVWIATGTTWYRASDFDGTPSGEVVSGNYLWVLTGATQKDTSWVLNTPDPIYIDDITGTSLNFVLYNHVKDVTAGTGITVTTVTGTHIISISPSGQTILNNAITGVTNLGGGETVCSSIGGHILNLDTIVGSGCTSISKVGNEVIIFSTGATSGGDLYTYASPSICPAGGMCVGTVLTGKTALKLLQEILVPELCGTLTPPSFSTTLVASTTYYEIGCSIPTLSVCGTFNRGCINPQYSSTSDKRVGYATCYVYTGAQVAGTYVCSGCSIAKTVTSYVVSGTPETWNITVCYGAGVQPLGQYGTPFNSACPASSLSNSKTICGVYPIFATTSAIGTLTKQSYVAMTTTPVQLVLVAESGGLKDRFEIPNSWTGNPLKCICTYNTFSSAWEWEGGSGAASLTTWTPSVSSETLCCGSAPYCLYTYNGACRLTTTCIRLVF